MTETLTTSLPQIEVQTHGRGRHAECRQTFGLGRHSLLGGQSRSRRVRRRTLRGAPRHHRPSPPPTGEKAFLSARGGAVPPPPTPPETHLPAPLPTQLVTGGVPTADGRQLLA